MTSLAYPRPHFPGCPKEVRLQIKAGIQMAGAQVDKWLVPLEAIGRYESNYHNFTSGSEVCLQCRGMFQLGTQMYKSAAEAFPQQVSHIDYSDPIQATFIAVRYIQSRLPGYGGYGGIGKLLNRTDRGPGPVLRYWIDHPRADFEKMRIYYRGY